MSVSLVIYGSRNAFPSLPQIDFQVERLGLTPAQVSLVVCGGAQDLPTQVIKPEWEKHGISAGLVRNAAMASIATHGVGFWKDWSRGTSHMTTCLVSLGKPVVVLEMKG